MSADPPSSPRKVTLAAAIPTHNRPRDVREAVESALAQGVSIEIVVVDDGSEPPVKASDLPPEVTLIRHEEALGPAGARNAAVQAAGADWVAFLDDDDRWLPEKAEAILDAVRRFPHADVVFHKTAYRAEASGGVPRAVSDPLARILQHQPPHLSGVAVRRHVHQAVRFDDTAWASEDIDYLIRLARGTTWIEIPRVLSVHTDQPETETAIAADSRVAGRLGLLAKHGELIRSDPKAHSFFYARLGHQYRLAGRQNEAKDAFQRSLRIRPLNRLAWSGLLRLYASQTGRGR